MINAKNLHQWGNISGVVAIVLILTTALVMQFYYFDLPCPLCLLQRSAFLLLAMALSMNLRFGTRPAFYSMGLLAGLFGFAISIHQVLLHVRLADDGFGKALLGLHLYHWAAIAFLLLTLFCAIMLLLPFNSERVHHTQPLAKILIGLLLVMMLINFLLVFVQCGFYTCPGTPTGYWL